MPPYKLINCGKNSDGTQNNRYEHILVAEKALGKSLPPKVDVHHVNENKKDNRPENLVICQDRAYHLLLHMRIRGRAFYGNVKARICTICKRYDMPENMKLFVYKNGTSAMFHVKCQREKGRKAYRRKHGEVKRTRIVSSD